MKNARHTSRRFFEIVIITILLASVFLFGAVQPLVLLGGEFLILLFFTAYMIVGLKRGMAWDKSPLFIPFIVFLATILIQLIPLPAGVMRFLSPQTFALRQMLGEEASWYSLSLVPIKTLYQLLRWTTVFVLF